MSMNSTESKAYSAFKIELYQSQQVDLENEMDALYSKQAANPSDTTITSQMAQIRGDLNLVRAGIGLWRTEESFWNQEINESKTAGKEGNKLASNA